MATTLGGTTLADPLYEHDGYELSSIDVGSMHEMADGSVAYDHVTNRYRFKLRWRAITSAEVTTIRTQYELATQSAVAFSPPDWSGTWTVIAEPNSYSARYIEDGSGTLRWDAELGLIEVGP